MIEVQERRAILRRIVTEYGLDIIAVDTAKKNEAKIKNTAFFKESKNKILKENLTTEQYLKKIDTGIYDDGFAIVCGQIRRGKYAGFKFIFVDIDLKEGVRAFLDTGDRKMTLEELADKQYVEFNGVDMYQRIHIPYILEPDAEIAAKGADDKLGIEINVNGVMFGAGSPHHNGGFYERLGKAIEIRILDKTQAFMLQEHLASICQKYGVNYSGNNEQEKEKFYQAWIAHLHDDGTRIKKGCGLESPIKYTITFQNQQLKEFAVTGSISEILSFLDENGYIVSEYGAKEALNSMITAFRDDGRIMIDRSVDFEGYYYHDGDVHVSKIDINKKHPARTKEECLACIKFIEQLSAFYLWKYKDVEIDRRDVLASAIKWTIAAPFNFAIKQLTRKWQKGFDMTGERDGGKSENAHIMLDIHGNFIDESSSSDSIYSVSSGSMNTEAKFGKGLSKTTYPIEISEFGRIEAYGRNEGMVEIVKKAIEDLTVRRGRDGARYDALFPSCSSIILNGNPFISKKGEILKRLHVVTFSEEDRHEANDPRTREFNELLSENRHKLKILGDKTIRYILENKDELLLSRKYSCYDLGRIALEKFYEFAGVQVPEWLTKWIADSSLVELDIDEESIIRSILFDNTHKTLQSNARLLEMENMGKITLEQRISLCLDNDLWSWIRKTKEEGKFYIDGENTWYTWQTALRLVQGYGRSIRSIEDWAITYVLDSGFENFVWRNKHILPDWFTQAIQSSRLKARLGHGVSDSDSSKALTPKENRNNPVTNNHYNSSIISEQHNVKQKNVNNTTEKNEIASPIPMKPSWLSETFANLDSYNKDESNRPERLFVCPYCPKFSTLVEREYQHHIVMKHPGKPGYPMEVA